MSAVWTLVRHSLRRSRAFLIATYLLLFVFQLFMIIAAREMEATGALKVRGVMPEFIARWTNMVSMSFRGIVLFGYTHPLVMLFLMALAIVMGSEPAGEIESKFVDLIMSRPVRRSAMIHRSVVVLILTVGGAIVCMMIGTWAGLKMFAPPAYILPEARTVLSLSVDLGLIVIAWGSITLAVSSFVKRRAIAISICSLLAFTMFVLDYVGRIWSRMYGISRISLFHYFSPFEMIGGRALAARDVEVLVAVIVAGWIVAIVVYARRDL